MATTEYLLECEVERVLSAMMPVNALVMRVMLHTGLRVGDVLALRFPLRVQMWITEKKLESGGISGLRSS